MYIAHRRNRAYILDVVYRFWFKAFLSTAQLAFSGGSRNFNTRECGPGAVEFLGSGDCFEAPSCIPDVFVVRVGHMIYIIYCKHCMLTTIKVYAYYAVLVKISKNNFFKRDGTLLVCRSWILLWSWCPPH